MVHLILTLLLILFLQPAKVFPAKVEKLIQINAEIVEVDVSKTTEFGIKWVSNITAMETSIPSIFSLGDFARLSQVRSDLKALMDEGSADLLANPKLVAKNGTAAMFNAGGEIPYITSTTNGSVNVDFKPYGVKLKIKPTIEPDGYINVEVEAEVSTPDEKFTVSLSGNIVPAILTRQVKSELNIKSGTTITLAGLSQTRKENSKLGIPILGDIPIIGALFSWRKIVDKKTSIVIFITPSILE
jgi:pilus assembly protein CpaC